MLLCYNSFCSRKCRNWQTSKTKDLVINAIVWVQVPSSAPEGANLNTRKRILHFFKKVVAVVVKFSK